MTARPLLAPFIVSALGLLALGGCASAPQRTETGNSPPMAGMTHAEAANAVLFRAMSLVGTPYRYGGNTPQGGFDCSGLVAYVFRDAAGISLPHQSAAMSELGGSRRLNASALQSGDLVFFRSGRHVSHVGIYVGEGRFVHAPNSGGTVRLDSLDGAWWREHFVYGRRVW